MRGRSDSTRQVFDACRAWFSGRFLGVSVCGCVTANNGGGTIAVRRSIRIATPVVAGWEELGCSDAMH